MGEWGETIATHTCSRACVVRRVWSADVHIRVYISSGIGMRHQILIAHDVLPNCRCTYLLPMYLYTAIDRYISWYHHNTSERNYECDWGHGRCSRLDNESEVMDWFTPIALIGATRNQMMDRNNSIVHGSQYDGDTFTSLSHPANSSTLGHSYVQWCARRACSLVESN